MHGGRLVIGVVAYVNKARFAHQGQWSAITDVGPVDEASSLELRAAPLPDEPPQEGR